VRYEVIGRDLKAWRQWLLSLWCSLLTEMHIMMRSIRVFIYKNLYFVSRFTVLLVTIPRRLENRCFAVRHAREVGHWKCVGWFGPHRKTFLSRVWFSVCALNAVCWKKVVWNNAKDCGSKSEPQARLTTGASLQIYSGQSVSDLRNDSSGSHISSLQIGGQLAAFR
jgi:hypothetical protein